MYFISIRLKLAPVASEEDVLTRKYPLSLHLVPKLLSLLNSSEGDGGMETPEKPDGSWITIAPLEGNGQNGTFRLTLYGQNALRNAGTLLNAAPRILYCNLVRETILSHLLTSSMVHGLP